MGDATDPVLATFKPSKAFFLPLGEGAGGVYWHQWCAYSENRENRENRANSANSENSENSEQS